jgi:hypothetical protein
MIFIVNYDFVYVLKVSMEMEFPGMLKLAISLSLKDSAQLKRLW